MLAMTAKAYGIGDTIIAMGTYQTDSVGARIAWARKQKKLTGHQLARAVGVRNIYISQLENNHREASRQLLQAIAAKLDTTVGFLLMETDEPQPARDAEPAPIYFSPEADEAAQLIDAAPPEERARLLTVLRALVVTFSRDDQDDQDERVIYSRQFAQRLIDGERSTRRTGELSR